MLLADFATLDLSVLPNETIDGLIKSLHYELARRKAFTPDPKPKAFSRKFDELHTRFGFRTYEEEITYLTTLYGSALYALPGEIRHKKPKDRMQYLPLLLAQDWTSVFPRAATDLPSYYVYAHVDPRRYHAVLAPLGTALNGEPFYIGKGSGQRAWGLKRNQGHGKRIATLRRFGYTEAALVSLCADTLTEQDALILEAKLIYFFGSIYDESAHGCLLNLADHMRPIFIQSMTKLPEVTSYYMYLRRMASDIMQAKQAKKSVAS